MQHPLCGVVRFLLLEILKTLGIRVIVRRFLIQTIVLFVLVMYLFTVLYGIIDPILFETNVINLVRFVEHSYNFILLVLLAISFLNFLEKDTKKVLISVYWMLIHKFFRFFIDRLLLSIGY